MPEADPSPDPKPAPRLGSYLLIKALGSGGMSNVFRAVHEESGSVVAVKVLPRTLAKNVTLLQRFIREAKSAESLDHPNIVAIYDRGFDQGRHYLVLEYVEGRDMHDRVRLNGPLVPGEAVSFIREVAGGLRYAAGQGMIHRDVKPANLLMTPDGHAKIIDLGLALQIEDEDERVTRDGTTVGTVDYMAPEQARDSRQTSERSDIYSLGCTFYYLMTGSPPYPGGGLSDKLARHYKAPIPDVREHRADVSESLSLLIRRMMEKKPENRYADYTQLIAALDSIGDPTAVERGGKGGVLDALIVDDDDGDEIGLAPTESAISRAKDERANRPPSTRDHLLTAEIVDDDDEGPLAGPPTLPPASPRPRTKEVPSRREPTLPAEVSLAELAALDSDEQAIGRRPGQGSSSSSMTRRSTASPGPMKVDAAIPSGALGALSDDDDEVEEPGGPPRRSSGDELPLKTWIAAGVLVGLSIAIIGFAASMLISMTKPEKPPQALENADESPTAPEAAPEPSPPVPSYTRKGPTAPPPKAPPPTPKTQLSPPPVAVAATLEEKVYPAELGARLCPTPPSRLPLPAERGRFVVRRVIQAGVEPQTSSLASALSRAGDVVEIADTGPFFEDDCQLAGKSRLIRARGGVRPMIKIEATYNEVVKEQAAKVTLGGVRLDNLVIEGIDIAVDVRDLPDHQQSLFLCQGAELTLRDCSLTILNANDPARANKYAIFRVEEGARPNRIVLERSTIRGSIRTLVEVAASRAEVVFDRSLVLGDSGPLIVAEPVEKPSRTFYFHRSLIATRGLVLDFAGRSTPPVVRSLGTTFAKIEGGTGASLFVSRAAFPGEPASTFDWSGEDNDFHGWPGWLASGPDASIRVPGVAAIRANWPASDASSREAAGQWPAWTIGDDVIPARFAALVPDRHATLMKIATPHPRLKELTVGSLAQLPAPELSPTLIPPFVPPVAQPGNPGFTARPQAVPPPPPQPNALGPRPRNPSAAQGNGATTKPVAVNPLNLTFNVAEAPWSGDLGRYLAEKLVAGTTRATIQVQGSGVHATSPVRLPDGISIAILGESNGGLKVPIPTFYPRPEAAGRSVLELHGGDLAVANLAFSAENAPRPRHWIMVEDGLLAIRHCRFRDPGGVGPDVGPMISFVAKGTAPIAPRVGPLVKETDRPTARLKDCLLWTGGEAISAEIGRGVVDLENCLIISGGAAITLLPHDVDRDRFEADLVMDRCTIAVDKTSILLGPLAGSPSGPSRPWLIATRKCVFPRTQTSGDGALLRVDPDAMARGTLFWQSFADVYEGGHFLTPRGNQPANSPAPDVKRQWIDLWGPLHTKSDQGPNPRRSETLLRYKEKPKPGKVVPWALELDHKYHKELGVEFKDLPILPRG